MIRQVQHATIYTNTYKAYKPITYVGGFIIVKYIRILTVCKLERWERYVLLVSQL